MCTAVQQIDWIETKRIGTLKNILQRHVYLPALYLIMPIIRDMLVRGGSGLDFKANHFDGKNHFNRLREILTQCSV